MVKRKRITETNDSTTEMETRNSHRYDFQCEPGMLSGKFKLSLWEYHSVRGYFDTLLSQSPKGTAIWDTEVSVCLDIEGPPKGSCVWGSLYSQWTLSYCCVLHNLDPRASTRGREGMKKWWTHVHRKAGVRWSDLSDEDVEAQHIYYLNGRKGYCI